MTRKKQDERKEYLAAITPEGMEVIDMVRREKGLSQGKVAERMTDAGYSTNQTTMSAWLRGRQSMPLAGYKFLYEALEKDKELRFLSDFIEGKEQKYWGEYIGITSKQTERKEKYRALINPDGRRMIDRVKNEKGLSQARLAERMTEAGCPTTQVTMSAWLRGRQSMPLAGCKILYEVLEKDERLRFLSDFIEGKAYWDDYITMCSGGGRHQHQRNISSGWGNLMKQIGQKQMDKMAIEELNTLRPLYGKFLEAYFDNGTPQRVEMIGRLENIIQEYRPGH